MGKTIDETIEELRPMDDMFFEKLANEPEFCEEVLQVILSKKDLKVIKVDTQKCLRNVKGRSVTVDVLCVDNKNIYYNIEMQKSDDDDHQRRVRYNGSNVDTFISEKGTKFKELPELYIVYISNFDIFKKDKVIYHVDRMLRETGGIVDNGYHEVYVNAQVEDHSEISELMKVFKSSSSEGNERFPRISRTIKHFKIGKGRDVMCKAVEEYAELKAKEAAEKAAAEKTKNIITNMLKSNMSDEEIMEIAGLSEEELDVMKAEILTLV